MVNTTTETIGSFKTMFRLGFVPHPNLRVSAEVLEYCGAFMQLYREQARYLERTAPWVERVGLGYVKQQLVDDIDNRQTLSQRFLESQHFAQAEDPWIARALGGLDTHEFKTLKPITASEIKVAALPKEKVA